MGIISLYIATSLDGYIADSNGDVDWLFHDADYGYTDFYDGVNALVMGRRTYDQVLGFGEWPWAGKRSYVFSNSPLHDAPPDAEAVRTDVSSFVRDYAGAHAGTVWLVGGANLAQQFQALGAIDEYVLSVHPILLGTGIPLFGPLPNRCELTSTRVIQFDSGLVQLHYRPRQANPVTDPE